MLSDEEIKAGVQAAGSKDKELGELLNDNKTVTLVPSKDRDFRGIVGDIERETQSYHSMKEHGHNTPKDALPLFRLMTWIDPQFVPGWTTAATIIADDRTDQAFFQGVQLLQEGLQANPKSVVLLNELGHFYAGKKHDYEKALTYLLPATELELDIKLLDENEGEAYQNAFRWTALCYREIGKPELQRKIAIRGLQRFPDDSVLLRLLGEPPYFLTEEGQHEWMEKMLEQAQPTSDFGHDDHDDHDHHDH